MIKFFRNIRKTLVNEGKTSKYFKYAIGEIVLVVIGILIALQVNNWNQTRLEQNQIKAYAKSLVQDLENDIKMLSISQFQTEKKFKYIDSLRQYVNLTPYSDLSNTDLWVITHDIIYRPFFWNRSTFNELKSSGGLQYIKNESLLKSLVAYESYSYHLDEDFEFDKTNAQKADELSSQLLNLNSPYISKLVAMENSNFGDRMFNIYETEAYHISKANDLKLLSYDETLIKRFVNMYIIIQDNYNIRGLKEMPEIIEDATDLITLLKKEYKL